MRHLALASRNLFYKNHIKKTKICNYGIKIDIKLELTLYLGI